MEKTNEILTIAGRRVEKKICEKGPCDKCCFFSHDCGCPYDMPCFPYWGPDYFAYFVPAKEIANKPQTDANKNEPTREWKADFLQTNDADKAAEKYGKEHTILPDEYNDGDIPVYEGWTADAFKDGIQWMRERLMKDAVEIDTDITINRYTKQHIIHISSTDEHIQHLPQGEYKAIIIKKENEK